HGQRLLVVPAAVADLALHVDVRHEIHFDAALAIALAGFAAAADDVEAEATGLVATLARLGQHGEQIADRREHLRVSRRVGARRAADWRLIDADDLVDLFRAGDRLMCAGLLARSIDGFGQRAVEDVIHQRAFSAAAYPRDNGHHAQRNAQVHVLQIMFACTGDGDPLA